MKELLLGWISKPKMQWTYIDDLVSAIEIIIISVVIITLAFFILELKDKIKGGK